MHLKSINKLSIQFMEGNILFFVEFIDYGLQGVIAITIAGKGGLLIFLAD